MSNKPKKSLVNLSLDADFLESMKTHAKDKGVEKISEYIQDWLRKLGLDRNDLKRAILQIPETALVSKIALQTWLHNRCVEIVNHYFKDEDAQ